MPLSVLTAWIVAHPYESLVALGALLSLVNGALPASVQRGPIGRALHLVLDRLAVLSRRDAPGTLKWPGVASAVLAPPPAPPPSVGPLAPPDQGGHVEGAALMGVCVVALAASLLCAGCPDWQRPACPTPGAYSCVHDQPHYCARATHELTPLGDEPCAAQGRACAVNDAGVARCVRASDGGAE